MLEQLCLWSAVPFLLMSVIEIVGRRYAFGLSESIRLTGTQLIYLLSLGAVHVYLTFFILGGLPEMKSWTKETRILKMPFTVHILLLWTAFFLLAFFGGSLFARPANWAIFYVMIFFMYVARLHHGLAQMQGISQIYNHAEMPALSERQKFEKFLTREKIAFNVIKFCVLGGLSFYVFVPSDYMGRLNVPMRVLFWGGVIASVYLLYNSYTYRSVGGKRKIFFLLRVFLYALQAFSFVAAIGSLFTHSIEYFMVADKMSVTSSVGNQKRKRLYSYLALAMIPIMGYTVFRYFCIDKLSFEYVKSSLNNLENFNGGTNVLFLVLVAFSFSIDFTHYYTDRVLFRMRSPNSRKYTAPLLKGLWPQEEA